MQLNLSQLASARNLKRTGSRKCKNETNVALETYLRPCRTCASSSTKTRTSRSSTSDRPPTCRTSLCPCPCSSTVSTFSSASHFILNNFPAPPTFPRCFVRFFNPLYSDIDSFFCLCTGKTTEKAHVSTAQRASRGALFHLFCTQKLLQDASNLLTCYIKQLIERKFSGEV